MVRKCCVPLLYYLISIPERAQLLSYSLEEESERWKSNLMEVERNLQVLVGNCTVASMQVAYAGNVTKLSTTQLATVHFMLSDGAKYSGICTFLESLIHAK